MSESATPTLSTSASGDSRRLDPTSTLAGGSRDPDRAAPRRASGGSVATVVLLIVSLVASGVTRYAATRFQDRHRPAGQRTIASRSSLAGMDSYALALLLGGLRGPLVMVLWANSEAQKADRDLEGIDTQIEWIRRLQPEFDTVHVFQMWNKAYNLSVQMVGLSNKYTTILDALDYGKSVDAERPDNLNILREIARIYADKLGTANPEKFYYRERIRRETRFREAEAGGPQRGQPGFQRLAHDSMLTPDGHVLPQFLAPRRPAGASSYDGSELQFLKQFEPFPFGISAFALGYNYHKRGQVLMTDEKQKPIQISASVQDSQPALTLKSWAEEEWEYGRRLEHKLFGLKLAGERLDQELPTAAVPVDAALKDAAVLPELLHSYDRSAAVAGAALAEYERHLSNPEFVTKRTMYGSHMDSLIAMRSMVSADRDYLLARRATGAARATLLASSASHYRNAIRDYGLVTLRYFTADSLSSKVLPPGVTRANVGTGAPGSRTAVTDDDIVRYMTAVRAELQRRGGPETDENGEDRTEYETYLRRAAERLNQIQQATKP